MRLADINERTGCQDLHHFRRSELHKKFKIFRHEDMGDFEHITPDDFPLLEIRTIRAGGNQSKVVGDSFGKRKFSDVGIPAARGPGRT